MKLFKILSDSCIHATLMLDFRNLQNMLDYFEHTLGGLVFYYFQSWKIPASGI